MFIRKIELYSNNLYNCQFIENIREVYYMVAIKNCTSNENYNQKNNCSNCRSIIFKLHKLYNMSEVNT